MTVMEEVLTDRLSDAGSTPARSIDKNKGCRMALLILVYGPDGNNQRCPKASLSTRGSRGPVDLGFEPTGAAHKVQWTLVLRGPKWNVDSGDRLPPGHSLFLSMDLAETIKNVRRPRQKYFLVFINYAD